MLTRNGILSADYKVAGGKLLRVQLSLGIANGQPVIHSMTITGDFFMHPEEAIESLEQALIGVNYQAQAIELAVKNFFSGEVEVIGAGPQDFVHIILLAGESHDTP